MTTEAAVAITATPQPERPYAPSWVNLVTAWIDGLPGPPWVFYLAFAAFTVVASNSIRWISGLAPVGTFDPVQTYYGLVLPATFWLIYALDHVARDALDRFRPAISVPDADIDRWQYELTVTPARPAALLTVFTVVSTLVTFASDPEGSQITGYAPLALAIRLAYETATGSILVILVYHSIRQLRLVSRIQARINRVDLFQAAPLYAFSKLTSRTAIGIIVLQAPTALFIPTTPIAQATWLGWLATISLLAVGIFALPLRGMHQRIAAEKQRLQAEVGRRIDATIGIIHSSVDARDFSKSDQLHNTLAALIAERDLVRRLPTWPWEAGTLGAVASAVLLPIGLWLVTRLLERVV